MSFDTLTFRQALGSFATGVCVITAQTESGEAIGMTANSFASVSLEPPLVLWSIQKSSDCFEVFEKSDSYGVNILSQQQQADSNRYAKKGEHALQAGDYEIGSASCPVLKNAIASFECKIVQRIDGGDHVILLGEVLALEHRESAAPLLFYAGQYRELK